MKTAKNLFDQILHWDNLLLAANRARKGKKYQSNVARFDFHLERELLRLQHELATKTYRPGSYRAFLITDPKERLISAAPYRDRVVHHALCNVIEPVFEKTFIHDSYANRKGKGTHRAIERYQHYARQYPCVLKCDIRKFFPSIDHAILKQEIRWKIACPDTFWLCELIIDNSNPQEEHLVYFPGDDLFAPTGRRRGLPIGNLTSQFWANVYLNRFDHFVKEELQAPGYVRYVDDFVLFAADKTQLHDWKAQIAARLAGLRLLPHPDKTQVHGVRNGVPFLGFRVFPWHRYVRKENAHRAERHIRRQTRAFLQGRLSPARLEAGLNSWLGHVRFGQCGRLERRVYSAVWGSGVDALPHPRGSWRVLVP